MKSKILSIITSAVIGFTGLASNASTAPGYKAPKPLATQEAAAPSTVILPLCTIGGLQGNFFQVVGLWVESGGNISFSIFENGRAVSLDSEYALGTADLPTGK